MRPETGRAVLAATAHLAAGPGLSDLAGRIAAAQTLALVEPTPATPLAPVPVPPTAAVRSPRARSAAGSLALLAAHGGAGVSSLLRAGLEQLGAFDADRCWPTSGPALVVARSSTGGLEQAQLLARQHAAGDAGPDVQLLGLVLIADAPGRLPVRVRELVDLVSGGFCGCWRLPWLEEWRLATASEPLPVDPATAGLRTDLRRLTACPPVPTYPVRSPSQGVLL